MPVGNLTSLGTTTAIDTSADVTLTHIGQNNGVNAAAPTPVPESGVTP